MGYDDETENEYLPRKPWPGPGYFRPDPIFGNDMDAIQLQIRREMGPVVVPWRRVLRGVAIWSFWTFGVVMGGSWLVVSWALGL